MFLEKVYLEPHYQTLNVAENRGRKKELFKRCTHLLLCIRSQYWLYRYRYLSLSLALHLSMSSPFPSLFSPRWVATFSLSLNFKHDDQCSCSWMSFLSYRLHFCCFCIFFFIMFMNIQRVASQAMIHIDFVFYGPTVYFIIFTNTLHSFFVRRMFFECFPYFFWLPKPSFNAIHHIFIVAI